MSIIKFLSVMNMQDTPAPKSSSSSSTSLILILLSLIVITITSVASATSTIATGCKDTLYPQACESLVLSTQVDSPSKTVGEIFELSVRSAIHRAHTTRSLAYNLSVSNKKSGTHMPTAVDDCVELLDHSLIQLNRILLDHKTSQKPIVVSQDDVRTWLSSALTHQETCIEGLENHHHKFPSQKDLIHASSEPMKQHLSNSLALHKSLLLASNNNHNNNNNINSIKHGERKLLFSDHGFPRWVSRGVRKLLEASIESLEPKAVVAQDGTGTHRTIAEALEFVSLAGVGGGGKTVIYVKSGTYNEKDLKIPASQSNIMLVGDGKGVTVISGGKSAQGGSTTFGSATFGVSGDGFMARDITFENIAGPAKHQAVALRVSSDKSVFFRCSIVGYQDTLYTLSNRQFYRETDIYGTVDFIFGNSAVVFQKCNISPRKPMSDQKNFITAQGRSDPNQNTGISIQGCRIAATSDLASSRNPTYLGRPWKQHSRTAVMESFLDGSISPAGWFPWAGGGSPSSVFYGEYMNSGPGASTSGRVHWPGYHPALTTAEASGFTVGGLISGNQWLPSTGVAFDSGLRG